MSETSGHEYLKEHQISGDVLLLDIERESDEVLKSAAQAGVGHAARTLVKDGPLRMVLMGLKAGSSIREHEADGPASVQVLSGSVKLTSEGRSDTLNTGKTLVLGASVKHGLEASEDSVVLVSIAWPEK